MKEGTVESCTCTHCVRACRERPGWMHPSQFLKISNFLKLEPLEAFKRHFSVDWWENYEGTGKRAYLIAPAILGSEGEYYPVTPIGECTFLVNDRCMIHEVKPVECGVSFHDGRRRFGSENRLALVHEWQTEENKELLRSMLGSDPHGPRTTILDLINIAIGMVK